MARILVIDSYDSFVYNIVQYLGELGAEPIVVRNDQISVADAIALAPDGVLLSPGPGRPEDAGIICDAISAFAGSVPVFGVCLGHQAIGHVYGGDVVRDRLLDAVATAKRTGLLRTREVQRVLDAIGHDK